MCIISINDAANQWSRLFRTFTLSRPLGMSIPDCLFICFYIFHETGIVPQRPLNDKGSDEPTMGKQNNNHAKACEDRSCYSGYTAYKITVELLISLHALQRRFVHYFFFLFFFFFYLSDVVVDSTYIYMTLI